MKDSRGKEMLDDGFGNVWLQCDLDDCALEIVRPGKVQCCHGTCGADEWARKHDLPLGDKE